MDTARVVSLHGELDISARECIDRELGRINSFGHHSMTVLDLSDVRYADSNFFNALIALHNSLAAEKSGVCLVASKHIARILKIVGFDHQVQVFENRSLALEHASSEGNTI